MQYVFKILVAAALIVSAFVFFGWTQKQQSTAAHTPFLPGEQLRFRLHYGIINAAEATITIQPVLQTEQGEPVIHIVGEGKSLGAFDWFFKVRDRYETYVHAQELYPLKFVRRVDEGGYTVNQDYEFYPHEQKVKISDKKYVTAPAKVQDMLSAFYYARTFSVEHLQIGDVLTIQSFVDGEVYPLQVKFLGIEQASCDLGKFECLKFCPIVQEGRIFKDEEDLVVYITNDANKIPILAEAKIYVGSIKMELAGATGLKQPLLAKK